MGKKKLLCLIVFTSSSMQFQILFFFPFTIYSSAGGHSEAKAKIQNAKRMTERVKEGRRERQKIENQTCFYQVDGEASCHLAAVLLKPEVRIRFPWRCLWDVLNELARGIDWMRMCWLGIIGRICVIRMILNIVKTELCLLIALVISTHCLLCFSQPRFIVIPTVHSKM